MGFISCRAPRPGAVAWILVGLALASNAAAQTTVELERGRSLFRQALSLEVAGDWAGALSRLENVSRIKMTPQVRFHQARCKEHLGRLTEALGDYRLAEYEASQANAVELADIRKARQELEIRVPRLVVRLSRELANSSVEVDNIAIGDSRLGKEIPVDPGEHLLVVRTVDGQSFVRRVRVAETTVEEITIEPPVGFVPLTPQAGRTPPPATRSAYVDANLAHRPPLWAWISGGVGVAGVVGASLLWYIRERAIDDLNNGCDPNNVCPLSLKSTQTRGEWASVAAPIAMSIGLAGLGVATYGFLAPSSRGTTFGSTSSSRIRLNIGCDTHSAGVGVAAAF